MRAPTAPTLSGRDLARFSSDGFLVLPNLVPAATIDALRVEADTVLVIVPPFTAGSTCTASENLAVAPAGKDWVLQLTVPFEPTGGLLHDIVGPLSCVSWRKVVLGGSLSAHDKSAASEGPEFVTSIVYVIASPGAVVPEPLKLNDCSVTPV